MHKIENTILLDQESPIFSLKTVGGSIELDIKDDLSAYIFACGKALSVIRSSIAKAQLSLSLLNIKYLESIVSEDKSKGVYIEMFIENSIIRVQSIYDRALIFTNRVLNLGISNESINHELIVTNDHVKKFSLNGKLKAINKACNEYRNIRNSVIHHDRYSEEKLDQLTMIIDADHLSEEAGRDPFIEPEKINELTKAYLGIKKSELIGYLDGIEEKLFSFYDCVLPIYLYQKEKIREKQI